MDVVELDNLECSKENEHYNEDMIPSRSEHDANRLGVLALTVCSKIRHNLKIPYIYWKEIDDIITNHLE